MIIYYVYKPINSHIEELFGSKQFQVVKMKKVGKCLDYFIAKKMLVFVLQ